MGAELQHEVQVEPAPVGAGAGPSLAQLHLLVVDDELEVRELLRDYFVRHNMVVSIADGGDAMRDVLARGPVDIVILDLKMPGHDGLTLARYLRSIGDFGIIMLTASVEGVDRIVGLEVGADDYVAKPFDPRELLARVRSLARRLKLAERRDAPLPRPDHATCFGRCVLDLQAQTLHSTAGELIVLTAMEFDLLRTFVERPNRVLSRDQLLTFGQNRDGEAFDRSIDVRILRLRRKIEENPEKPRFLRTVRGVGYVFDPLGRRSE